jgi:hypothetical protein
MRVAAHARRFPLWGRAYHEAGVTIVTDEVMSFREAAPIISRRYVDGKELLFPDMRRNLKVPCGR